MQLPPEATLDRPIMSFKYVPSPPHLLLHLARICILTCPFLSSFFKVTASSPGEKAGLTSFFDFITAANGQVLVRRHIDMCNLDPNFAWQPPVVSTSIISSKA